MDNDFIGFSFQPIIDGTPGDKYHSSVLGIKRVSDGSRYTEYLLPTMKEETAEIPGGDGTYYWNTFNTQAPITISIAYDDMSEKQKRQLSTVFNGKNLGYLIYDEYPYKKYTVKTTGSPQLNYVCFEEKGKRVYKGEGTLSFVAFYPYATSVFKYLDKYDSSNKSQWSEASGLLSTQGNYDVSTGVYSVKLYNPGDLEADFKAYFNIGSGDCVLTNLQVIVGSTVYGTLKFDGEITQKGTDQYICIDTATHLVQGYDENFKRTGNLYNEHIISGDFMKIPVNTIDGSTISLNATDAMFVKLEYDYLYF